MSTHTGIPPGSGAGAQRATKDETVPVKVSIGEARRIGYFVPEFPGQTHAFFWRQYQDLWARGLDPVLVSTRKPAQGIISPTWSNGAMLQTQYLGSPDLSVATGAIPRLASVHPRAWGGCLASISRGEPWRLLDCAGVTALVFTADELSHIASIAGFSHVYVHSCTDAANVCLLACLLFGPSYSLTLHGPLHDYGSNQREKWRHARFAIVITQRLLQEVQRELIGALPE